jgi:hypothetical protein
LLVGSIERGGHTGSQPRRHIVQRELFERDVPHPPQGVEFAATLRTSCKMRPNLGRSCGVEPLVKKVLQRGP